jgi:gamma-glutamylcyclotransferase (GGCT)/AIG2-like uncharacterized protein YtfP
MCKPISEGGQRCAAHTRPKFQAAVAGTQAWDDAAADHASTRTGHDELLHLFWAAEEAGDVEQMVALETAMKRGQQIRDANEAAAEAIRNKDIPVFVYGTLRNSEGNYQYILQGRTVAEEPAVLDGAAMYSNGGFPYVVSADDGQVVGELMHLDPQARPETMQRLDQLEGYRGADEFNHYERNLVQVKDSEGSMVTAWAYLAEGSVAERAKQLEPVPDGDWIAGSRRRRF